MIKELTNSREIRAAIVAQMHLVEKEPLSQAKIAHSLGIDKATVSRLLHYARETGMVSYMLNLPREQELEVRLIRAYGLAEAYVVPILFVIQQEHKDMFRALLGQAAARYVEGSGDLVKSNSSVGLGCGATIRQFVIAALPGKFYNMSITQLVVETDTEAVIDESPFTLVGMLYAKWRDGSRSTAIQPLPGTLHSVRESSTQPPVKYVDEILRKASEVDTAIVGIGSASLNADSGSFARIFKQCGFTNRKLLPYEIVGEICNRPFNREGIDVFDRIVEEYPEVGERTAALPLDRLRSLVEQRKRVVAVAGGQEKLRALHTALSSRFISHLVTDIATAEALCGLEATRL